MWCNALSNEFAARIRAVEKSYDLEVPNALWELIKRKSQSGTVYVDGKHILQQVAPLQARATEDLFIDYKEEQPPPPQVVAPIKINAPIYYLQALTQSMAHCSKSISDAGIDDHND